MIIGTFVMLNRKWFKPKSLRNFGFAFMSCYLLCDVATIHLIVNNNTDYCQANSRLMLYRQIQLIVQTILLMPFSIIFVFVIYKLRRHPHDGYNMTREFSWCISSSAIPLILLMALITDKIDSIYRLVITWLVHLSNPL
jgi:hypothetical protein